MLFYLFVSSTMVSVTQTFQLQPSIAHKSLKEVFGQDTNGLVIFVRLDSTATGHKSDTSLMTDQYHMAEHSLSFWNTEEDDDIFSM